MKARWLILVCTGLFFTLAGPSPGAVGACGEKTGLADVEQFCTDKATWVITRSLLRGEYGEECGCGGRCACDEGDTSTECMCQEDLKNAAFAEVPARCMGATLPCQPTERQTEACISALMNPDNLSRDEAELVECDVCSGRPPAEQPEEDAGPEDSGEEDSGGADAANDAEGDGP